MMLFAMWTTVLTITLQIHNGEAKPFSFSGLKSNFTTYPLKPSGLMSNFTTYPLEIDQTPKMPVTEKNTLYPIYGSTMTLNITSNPATALSPEDVKKDLGIVLQIAKDGDKSILLKKVWRIEDPSTDFHFAIFPPFFVESEFTWGDVASTVSGLLDYFEESRAWVESKFEVKDLKRGLLAFGVVGKLLVDTTKTAEQGVQ